MKKILVTGGAGFIGSYIVDLLVSKNKYKVYSIDDMSGGFWRNINPKCSFEKINLVNKKQTQYFIQKIRPEIIFHLAADATEGRSQFTPINCTERNYLAFLNTIVPAIHNGLEKFIAVSSMSVYGAQKTPFLESMPPQPEDIYGISKAAMENALKILAEVHKFDYSIVRPHNVYGPRQNISDPYRNVIGIFINSLLNNKNYFIYGDGNQKRSFSYIDDVAPYIVKVGLSNSSNGEIFNIGPDKEYTVNELSDKILKIFFGNLSKLPKTLKPIYLSSRPKEVQNAFSSNTKIKEFFKHKPEISLDSGLELMVNWAKTIGPQKFRYLKKLELTNESTPITWINKK